MSEAAYEFDVALSFAGADREVARVIAEVATANQVRVFIDEEHVWESWGKNLNEYLGEIYDRKARFCMILVSKEYCEKSYTNLERRRALDRALESRSEYILPVLLDDSWLEGLPRATAYLDLRKMPAVEIGKTLVRKVRGADGPVVTPDGVDAPKVAPAGPVRAAAPVSSDPLLTFLDIHVADECKSWKAADGELTFHGGVGYYEDPIFDITVLSRSADPTYVTAVGITVVEASCSSLLLLGGGGSGPLNLHRTYQLDLPDVWRALAEKYRHTGDDRHKPQAIGASAGVRLPDPIEIEPRRAYRFGLHLFGYVDSCPTEVWLQFGVKTDRGEARSAKFLLQYTIGGDIAPLQRFYRMLRGEEEVRQQEERAAGYVKHFGERDHIVRATAYELWEQAGRPQGRDQEFWEQAERELASRSLTRATLRGVYQRPLLAGESPQRVWKPWF